MIVTEEQAADMQCRQYPIYLMPQPGKIMGTTEVKEVSWKCVGRRCMAWRWYEPYHLSNPPPPVTQGYCGFAGMPMTVRDGPPLPEKKATVSFLHPPSAA